MKVENLKIIGSWRDVKDAARTTVGLIPGDSDPPSYWKKRMLLAEHSPIRMLMVSWIWVDLPSWVSVHMVRHKIGIEHFVSTQRTDRTGVNRGELPQGALVRHKCIANAQAIITISRKRLCGQAAFLTQMAWAEFLISLNKKEPELYEACVPECFYRGFCPEFKSCGRGGVDFFKESLERYRKV